jgi:hypothetical protein
VVWELFFMLVVLKIPVVYLCAVVWWAIRAEPVDDGELDSARTLVPLTPCGWEEWRRRRGARLAGRRPVRPVGGAAARRARTRVA